MDINTLLSELVVVADALDEKYKDISADVDAAIFIMSSDSALPRNKSLASVVRENYAAVSGLGDSDIEEISVAAAEEIALLMDEVISQSDPAAVVAVLTSMAQSLRSVMHPNGTLSPESIKQGSEFLQAAEAQLSEDEDLHAIGYRVGLIRSKIENS
jgi:hypothetical protein